MNIPYDWKLSYIIGGWALPLWKMMEWKSVGMMKFPTEWKNKIHVPNHQPDIKKTSPILDTLQKMTNS